MFRGQRSRLLSISDDAYQGLLLRRIARVAKNNLRFFGTIPMKTLENPYALKWRKDFENFSLQLLPLLLFGLAAIASGLVP